ncbi:MFS transporter [Fusarium oxysporum]|nr:MFS transporter [Fusarium oxysporum]
MSMASDRSKLALIHDNAKQARKTGLSLGSWPHWVSKIVLFSYFNYLVPSIAPSDMMIEKESLPSTVDGYSSGRDNDSNGPEQRILIDWSEAEERALVRKLDLLIMPLLIAGFFVLQLDRGNIGNALTDFFLPEVGITQFQFNIGNQLLSLGIVLLELPSNLVLYRLGPQKWISCQIFCWGLVATFQAFIKGKGVGAYYATRLLLGLLEAGFIPAGLYTLTQWYKRNETSRRFTAFFLGNMIASAASGLIAYGILQMRGIAGLSGWQWMFLLEGIITIVIGVVFAFLMPNSPANPSNIFGHLYFTPQEIHILTNRITIDNPTQGPRQKYVKWVDIKSAFSRWCIYPQLTVSFCCIAIISPLGTYQPSIIASYGYDRLQANALSSVGGWIVIVLNLSFGWIADKIQRRGFLILLATVLSFAFCLATRQLAASTNRDLKYGILTCTTLWGSVAHPLNGSWLAVNIRNPAERSITMALLIMTANAAGLAGAQIFQAHDAPLYRTGFTVILTLASIALVFAIVSNGQYLWLNKKLAAKGQLEEEQVEAAGEGDRWRFSL